MSLRYPKPLIDKIGVKSGMRVRIVGARENAGEEMFWDQADERAVLLSRGTNADMILFFVGGVSALERLPALRRQIRTDGSIWVIYPKGIKTIREVDVIAAGKVHGLVDIKIASFSSTHTAMKLVIPVAQRT